MSHYEYKTQLSCIVTRAQEHPSLPAFKIPEWGSDGLHFEGWKSISYSELLGDVEKAARYWAHELSERGLSRRDVVGIWAKGYSYLDAVHIWGIARAGFIPQLASLKLTNAEVVYRLLGNAKAKALVFEPAYQAQITGEIISLPLVNILPQDLSQLPLPDLWTPSSDEDIMMIFHSSGSTSGLPKLVPLTARWLDFTIRKMKPLVAKSPEGADKQVTVLLGGNLCHLAGNLCPVSFLEESACSVFPTEIPYSTEELKRMNNECSPTILFMFSGVLGETIREAQKDQELLSIMKGFTSILHGGLPLGPDEDSWGQGQGMKLANIFGSTEVGLMMQAVRGNGPDSGLLKPFPGTKYKFVPMVDSGDSDASSAGERLFELVVPAESHDIPHESLRNKETGMFHTGDLFAEMMPGLYESRGRNDDWIKMSTALRCDTKSIEQNAMETCGDDLISAAVVVGTGCPSPALFIEPRERISFEECAAITSLKDKVLRRITPFHRMRYIHERIDDSRLIFVVPQGSLPRTGKGSIQRKLVQSSFESDLSQAYAAIST